MSYQKLVIGTVDAIQEYRLICIKAGDPEPQAAQGYTVIKIATMLNIDIYMEYKVYTGDVITPT